MSDDDLPTFPARQPDKLEEQLQSDFLKDLSGQANRLDDFARQLIKLQLAIPAIYAATLKISSSPAEPYTLLLSFLIWLFAFGLTILSLQPLKYQIDQRRAIELPLPEHPSGVLSINAYYHFAAKYKMRLLTPASCLTFFGIALSVLSAVLPTL